MLEQLSWAPEILVVDSFSTDETLNILKSFPRVRVVQREFDQHSAQWNFGLDQCQTTWVLALDADYVLSDDLVAELQAWQPVSTVDAYFARFRYCVFGRPLRGSLYPARAVLFRRDSCCYEQDGHTQTLRVKGNTGWLGDEIFHDDRKPLRRWLEQQQRYAGIEVRHLLETPHDQLSLPDRLRKKVILAPPLILLYTLLGKGLILDGWPGWSYAFQRTVAEMVLSLHLIEAKLK